MYASVTNIGAQDIESGIDRTDRNGTARGTRSEPVELARPSVSLKTYCVGRRNRPDPARG